MWTTSAIKAKARKKIKLYFWDALIISIIFGLFAGDYSGNAASSSLFDANDISSLKNELYTLAGKIDSIKNIPYLIESTLSRDSVLLLSILASVATISLLINIAVNIFVKPAFIVGKNRFYTESSIRNSSAGIKKVLWGFRHNYLNVVWVMFFMNVLITLGTFFFVIPGIYLSFCYLMVPYILTEKPDMKARDAMRLSKEMMDGNKFGAFILGISFIGWRILAAIIGLFTFGLGNSLVEPYVEAAYAELYLELRKSYSGQNFDKQNDTCDNGYTDDGGASDDAEQYTERDAYADGYEESGTSHYAESSGYAGYGHYQRTDGWTDIHEANESVASPEKNDRGKEVKRSEGGPGRGYYLNGVFYPYTEDELRELRENENH